MADNALKTQSYEYARDIIILCRKLKQNGVEYSMVNQLLRCGTSVGANIAEAQYAQGSRDFISKFEIALKECNESEYWIKLLCDIDAIPQNAADSLLKKCISIKRMLVATITTLKKKI